MKKRGALFIFYLLVAYICLQFGWWAYMLVNLNNDLAEKNKLLLLLSGAKQEQIIDLDEKLRMKWFMIAGEGTVFFILLSVGILKTRSAFKKEMNLSKQQKNFLLSVTHELKSPLASGKLQLQTLLKHELSKEKQEVLIKAALADNERLIKLTDNLLVAAKMENSNFSLEKEETDLSDLINNTLKPFMEMEKGRLVAEIPQGIKMKADVFAFPSIVTNLYENARKYSPADSVIKFSLNPVAGKIILSCSDEGAGILPAEREKIFDKFYRVGNEETRKSKGTGLGLYIVKKIAEMHSGTVIVKDNQPKGSIFEIHFKA
jgi:K+-sensing histidine kinase KdpD